MKILVALDSFRGTVSAWQGCDLVARGLREALPEAEIVTHPLADGGEGTAEVLALALGGARRRARVAAPIDGERVDTEYWWVRERSLALLDMASVVGGSHLPPRSWLHSPASTRGLGEMIAATIWTGATEIWFGVGGCVTLDAGVGAASVLGWRFLGRDGEAIQPGSRGLLDLHAIEPPKSLSLPPISILCDVAIPLLGEDGAARAACGTRATEGEIGVVEAALENFVVVTRRALGLDVSNLPGSGAAGGFGAGAAAFLDARLISGTERVKAMTRFEAALDGVDWVITGEGGVDDSSFVGKVLSGVLVAARSRGIPVAVITGELDISRAALRDRGVGPTVCLTELAGSFLAPLVEPEVWLPRGGRALARRLRGSH